MAFTNRVLLLMNSAVFLQIAGVATGVSGGTRPPLGVQEQIPDRLFIAKPDKHDNGFLTSAKTFHKTYGFVNNEYSSIEEIIDELIKSTNPIGCMRIVTHAFTDFLAVKLFKNSISGIDTAVLAGFAQSDSAGLKSILAEHGTQGHLIVDASRNVLHHLRQNAATPSVLTPFGLDDAQATVSAPMLNYLWYCMDYMALNPITANDQTVIVLTSDDAGITSEAPLTKPQRKDVQDALLFLINNEAQALVAASVTIANVQELQTALLLLTRTEMLVTSPTFSVLADAVVNIVAAHKAVSTRQFRTKLNAARARFTKTSRIDIRGCVIARNGRTGLQAIQAFFGQAGNLPMVTGPDWFQGFPGGAKSVNPAEATTLFASGFSLNFPESKIGTTQPPPYKVTYRADDVQDAFTRWASLTHFTELFTFLTQQFSLSPFDFTSYIWQPQTVAGGPGMPVLGMDAHRIDGLLTQPFADSIQQFRLMFRLSPAVPSTGNRKKIGQLQPLTRKLIDLQKAIDTGITARASLPTELKALYIRIKAVAISGINPPTTPIVPTDAQADQLKRYATDLHTHLDTMLAKLYETFFADITAALALPITPFLTYLSMGLPMLIENRKRVLNLGPLDDPVVFHPSDSTLLMDHELRNEALRSFLKTLWTGTPTQLTSINRLIAQVQMGNSSPTLRPLLSEKYFIDVSNEENGRSDAGFSPLVEYNNHIVVEPATP